MTATVLPPTILPESAPPKDADAVIDDALDAAVIVFSALLEIGRADLADPLAEWIVETAASTGRSLDDIAARLGIKLDEVA